MAVGQDGLRHVLDAFEQGEWDEIHLVADDVEVHLIAGAAPAPLKQTSHVSGDAGATSATRAAAPPDAENDAASSVGPPVSGRAGSTAVGELVVAPSPGIFWRAPNPTAPPFTEVGAHVERRDALCIVEVMKLMNTLEAPVSGTVVEIYAGNGEQVAAGTPLFRIRPDGT